MNKHDLVRELSERLSITQRECMAFLDCLNQITVERLQQNDTVKLPGLGRLSPRIQTARPGRNPHTGVECPIPERMNVKFKTSLYLLEALNPNIKKEDI